MAFVNCESKNKDNGNLFNKNNETSIWKFDEFCSNIGWMPIMLGKSLGSKTWSWPSNFMKIISSNVDETCIVYSELSSMNW
jgi:hypothetical protein